jgi:hypothetical protein
MKNYKNENPKEFKAEFADSKIENIAFEFQEISFNIRYINDSVNYFVRTKIYLAYNNITIGHYITEFTLCGEVTDDNLILY